MSRFAPVVEAFHAQAALDPTYSAQLAVHHQGELVVDETVGTGLAPDSLLPVFSSSKGAIGIVVALLVERGQLDLDARVSTYWPEFSAAGKESVTVRQLLSHQAGLLGVDGGWTDDELLAHEPLAKRLAEQRPMWQPGSGFGYHALTIGTLADELVRRIDGRTLATVFADDVTGPRGLDVHLGVPAALDHRVAAVDLPTEAELAAWGEPFVLQGPETLAGQAVPVSDRPLFLRVNDEDYRRVGPPAAGGLATARGLSGMYAALHHDLGGGPLLSEDTVAQVSQLQVTGTNLTSGLPLQFAVVFMKPCAPRLEFGSWRAFGHDGLGGSMAFSDPHHDVTFGYLVKRIPLPGVGAERGVDLTRVVRSCLA